jgi:hypothetical protein
MTKKVGHQDTFSTKAIKDIELGVKQHFEEGRGIIHMFDPTNTMEMYVDFPMDGMSCFSSKCRSNLLYDNTLYGKFP